MSRLPSTRELFEMRFTALDQTRVTSRQIAAIGKAALDVRDNAKSIADKAASHPHFNDDGKRAATQKALFPHFVENEQARQSLGDIRAKVESDLTALALPALDKTDLAAALLDQEARSIVRGLPQDRRDNLDRLPPALAAAVVRVPAELSGVSPSVHKMLRDQLIEIAHPEKVAGARGDLEGIDVADLVVKEADASLRAAVQLAPHEINDFFKRVKTAAGVPKKVTESNPNDVDALVAAHRQRIGLA